MKSGEFWKAAQLLWGTAWVVRRASEKSVRRVLRRIRDFRIAGQAHPKQRASQWYGDDNANRRTYADGADLLVFPPRLVLSGRLGGWIDDVVLHHEIHPGGGLD